MSDYAKAKGRTQLPAENAPGGRKASTRPLSPAEVEAVSRNKAFVQENMPELVPFIRELHDLGMIAGWRAVTGCQKAGGEG